MPSARRTVSALLGAATLSTTVLLAGAPATAAPAGPAPTSVSAPAPAGVSTQSVSTQAVTVRVVTGGVPAVVRASATTASGVVRTLPDGSSVSLECHVRGQTVSGGVYGVTSNVWNRTSGGYVWDGLLDTGSNDPVVPACGSTGAARAAAAAQAFRNAYVGRAVDVDGYYGAQCWDLAARFTLDNGIGTVYTGGNTGAANAYLLYGSNGNARAFERHANVSTDPSSVPRAGDLLVWDTSWGGGYGHIAIVLSANWNTVTVLQQNPGAANVATYDYRGVMGWLRPRVWA
ncbi:CHAP domain-containing protein [Nocardioides sp. CPCC 205120]|uniref:CHAP domain-containing protein n=1 Tax=Nocardioides sp. CPCC 205120 TaxID=3406462 RepID=UPI003B50C53F